MFFSFYPTYVLAYQIVGRCIGLDIRYTNRRCLRFFYVVSSPLFVMSFISLAANFLQLDEIAIFNFMRVYTFILRVSISITSGTIITARIY